MQVDPSKCVDCGAEKGYVSETHSLQCEDCQEKLFSRVRKNVREREKKMSLKAVRNLMDQGQSVDDIVANTGLARSTVQTYASKVRKEKQQSEVTRKEAANEVVKQVEKAIEKTPDLVEVDSEKDKEIKALRERNRNLETSCAEMEDEAGKVKQELYRADIEIEKMVHEIEAYKAKLAETVDVDEYNSVKRELENLQHLNEKLSQEVEKWKGAAQEMSQKVQKTENKHKYLFKYLMATNDEKEVS